MSSSNILIFAEEEMEPSIKPLASKKKLLTFSTGFISVHFTLILYLTVVSQSND